MRRFLGPAGLGVMLLASGCASVETSVIELDDQIYLTTLGPIASSADAKARVFCLGAGDSLGEALFVEQVAIARLEKARDRHVATELNEPLTR